MKDADFITFLVGDAEDALRLVAAFTGKPVGDIIRDHTGMLARYMANSTPPNKHSEGSIDGGSKAAQEIGRAMVRRDIRRVYLDPGKVFADLRSWHVAKSGAAIARAYYRKLKQGDVEGARAILRRVGHKAANLPHLQWDGGAKHRSIFGGRGRVSKSTRPSVVSQWSPVKGYIREEERRVGFTKSGWVTAASDITTKGLGQIAGWIRSQRAPGQGRDNTRDTSYPTVSLTNAVPWISELLKPDLVWLGLRAVETQLGQSMNRALEYHLSKIK